MLARNKIKTTLMLLSSLMLFACESTNTVAPDWYSAPQTNETGYLIAVGQGRSLEQAKKSALSQINAQLWTQIDSSFSSNDVYRTRNEQLSTTSLINNRINSKTATVTFTDIEYPLVDKNDIAYYVQAKVKRSSVIKQLQSDVRQINERAKAQLDNLKHQDSLIWWLDNRNFSAQAELASVRQAMLRSMGDSDIPSTSSVVDLLSSVSRVQSNIVVRFIAERSDKIAAELLASQLSEQTIKTTFNNNANVTHVLRMTTSLRQNKVGNAYVSTQFTTLQLEGRKGNTLATNEIISSGNSLSNYAFSKEGAQRHFSEIVSNQGVWASLGLNIK